MTTNINNTIRFNVSTTPELAEEIEKHDSHQFDFFRPREGKDTYEVVVSPALIQRNDPALASFDRFRDDMVEKVTAGVLSVSDSNSYEKVAHLNGDNQDEAELTTNIPLMSATILSLQGLRASSKFITNKGQSKKEIRISIPGIPGDRFTFYYTTTNHLKGIHSVESRQVDDTHGLFHNFSIQEKTTGDFPAGTVQRASAVLKATLLEITCQGKVGKRYEGLRLMLLVGINAIKSRDDGKGTSRQGQIFGLIVEGQHPTRGIPWAEAIREGNYKIVRKKEGPKVQIEQESTQTHTVPPSSATPASLPVVPTRVTPPARTLQTNASPVPQEDGTVRALITTTDPQEQINIVLYASFDEEGNLIDSTLEGRAEVSADNGNKTTVSLQKTPSGELVVSGGKVYKVDSILSNGDSVAEVIAVDPSVLQGIPPENLRPVCFLTDENYQTAHSKIRPELPAALKPKPSAEPEPFLPPVDIPPPETVTAAPVEWFLPEEIQQLFKGVDLLPHPSRIKSFLRWCQEGKPGTSFRMLFVGPRGPNYENGKTLYPLSFSLELFKITDSSTGLPVGAIVPNPFRSFYIHSLLGEDGKPRGEAWFIHKATVSLHAHDGAWKISFPDGKGGSVNLESYSAPLLGGRTLPLMGIVTLDEGKAVPQEAVARYERIMKSILRTELTSGRLSLADLGVSPEVLRRPSVPPSSPPPPPAPPAGGGGGLPPADRPYPDSPLRLNSPYSSKASLSDLIAIVEEVYEHYKTKNGFETLHHGRFSATQFILEDQTVSGATLLDRIRTVLSRGLGREISQNSEALNIVMRHIKGTELIRLPRRVRPEETGRAVAAETPLPSVEAVPGTDTTGTKENPIRLDLEPMTCEWHQRGSTMLPSLRPLINIVAEIARVMGSDLESVSFQKIEERGKYFLVPSRKEGVLIAKLGQSILDHLKVAVWAYENRKRIEKGTIQNPGHDELCRRLYRQNMRQTILKLIRIGDGSRDFPYQIRPKGVTALYREIPVRTGGRKKLPILESMIRVFRSIADTLYEGDPRRITGSSLEKIWFEVPGEEGLRAVLRGSRLIDYLNAAYWYEDNRTAIEAGTLVYGGIDSVKSNSSANIQRMVNKAIRTSSLSEEEALEGASANRTVGEEVARIRQEKGLTMVQLAREIGVGFSHLSELERGYRGRAGKELRRKLERHWDLPNDYFDSFPEGGRSIISSGRPQKKAPTTMSGTSPVIFPSPAVPSVSTAHEESGTPCPSPTEDRFIDVLNRLENILSQELPSAYLGILNETSLNSSLSEFWLDWFEWAQRNNKLNDDEVGRWKELLTKISVDDARRLFDHTEINWALVEKAVTEGGLEHYGRLLEVESYKSEAVSFLRNLLSRELPENLKTILDEGSSTPNWLDGEGRLWFELFGSVDFEKATKSEISAMTQYWQEILEKLGLEETLAQVETPTEVLWLTAHGVTDTGNRQLFVDVLKLEDENLNERARTLFKKYSSLDPSAREPALEFLRTCLTASPQVRAQASTFFRFYWQYYNEGGFVRIPGGNVDGHAFARTLLREAQSVVLERLIEGDQPSEILRKIAQKYPLEITAAICVQLEGDRWESSSLWGELSRYYPKEKVGLLVRTLKEGCKEAKSLLSIVAATWVTEFLLQLAERGMEKPLPTGVHEAAGLATVMEVGHQMARRGAIRQGGRGAAAAVTRSGTYPGMAVMLPGFVAGMELTDQAIDKAKSLTGVEADPTADRAIETARPFVDLAGGVAGGRAYMATAARFARSAIPWVSRMGRVALNPVVGGAILAGQTAQIYVEGLKAESSQYLFDLAFQAVFPSALAPLNERIRMRQGVNEHTYETLYRLVHSWGVVPPVHSADPHYPDRDPVFRFIRDFAGYVNALSEWRRPGNSAEGFRRWNQQKLSELFRSLPQTPDNRAQIAMASLIASAVDTDSKSYETLIRHLVDRSRGDLYSLADRFMNEVMGSEKSSPGV